MDLQVNFLTVGHRKRRFFGQPSPNRTHRAATSRNAGRRGMRETTGIATCSRVAIYIF